ncbi:MAG: NAD(P)H-dependent oxidoreductase subunit E [Candidatus Omnitrophica bacterium]|nr:NAD(P)H-dependent oxidoreductase subunit E [Candidatus Omnitrophota bacterium]MDD5042517.1 NAD(P)H-dependent oxidoreductase subunit E [Candidatus Omnitrophota bacterium]MDD5500722.1 NAD(P)H-dependent oxidoreductase subunit E [Candidatus Omnitrophota bacterium]
MTENTKNMQEEIANLVEKWKGKEGNLIMILHELQNYYGYIPRPAALELSRALETPLARIYEVITFYNFFKLSPPGKHTIALCMGTACYLKGAPVLLNEIKNLLNVEEGQTTKDGLFQLDVVRCLGCCGLAPVIKIDEKVYGKVQKSQVMGILSEYGNHNQEG